MNAIVYSMLLVVSASAAKEAGPFQATGIRVGEVDDHSAIVWTRLTQKPERNPADGPELNIEYAAGLRRERDVKSVTITGGATTSELRDGAPGIDGDVRLRWCEDGGENWSSTEWTPVDPLRDFTHQFKLDDLKPDTAYQIRVDARAVDGTEGGTTEGSFRTAPLVSDAKKILFTVVTCFGNDDEDSPEGFKLYNAMGKQKPAFFVHTGDIIYYDEQAKTAELARYHWQRMFGWPTAVAFHKYVPGYFMKDDHDTWCNDCWPTMKTPYMHDFTFRQGQEIFREQTPMGPKTYRTARWGKDLQIWLVEGRDFRSPNTMPDGPGKTILGKEQKEWLKKSLAESDATYRILISATPIVGPDRALKADNHANSGFKHEGDELRTFLSGQKNTIVVCGDRHWQYMSVDPKTGLREYSCGPASDEHAGGWKQSDYRPEMHRFLRVAGGYLSVCVDRESDTPTLTLQFHDVDGNVKFEDQPFAPTGEK